MPGAGALGKLAFLQMWRAARKLHHIQAALQLAHGVAQQFTVFRRHQMDEFLLMLFDQSLELEQHPRPALRVDRSPGWLRCLGSQNCLRQDFCVTVLENRLYLTGAWIVDRAGDGANPRHTLTVDEMADRAHGLTLCRRARVIKPHAGSRRHWT